MMQQMTLYDFVSQPSPKKPTLNPLPIGSRIGRVVLGECRIATITKVEGLPNYPFYRTDRGICYSYQEGLNSVDDLFIQAEKAREKYKTVIPANLESRITVEYAPRPADGRSLWAQLGTLELDGVPFLFWKEDVTYQFLEPYPDKKQLKKAYKKHEKQILKNVNEIPYVLLDQEKTMERLYWSERHNCYATAEYVAFNG